MSKLLKLFKETLFKGQYNKVSGNLGKYTANIKTVPFTRELHLLPEKNVEFEQIGPFL
jgi:hypothetical protein